MQSLEKNKDGSLPLLSIACITYNQEPYIRQCLDGFIMQKTNFKFEIVIHDDASTDGTADIIKDYIEKYPDLFVPILQKKNRYSEGKGILVPYVFPKCRGKYIAFCEGDDYWIDPLKLQKQVDYLETHDDCGIVHTDFDLVYGNRRHQHYSSRPRNRLEALIKGNYSIDTLTVMMRKSKYDIVKDRLLNNRFPMGDSPMWIEMASVSNVGYIDDVTSKYRILANSASHNTDTNIEIAFCKAAIQCRKYYAKVFNVEFPEKDARMQFYDRVFHITYKNCDGITAKKYLCIAKTENLMSTKLWILYLGSVYIFFRPVVKMIYQLLQYK